MPYRSLLERVISFATAEGQEAALKSARAAFFAATGEVFEDDPSFETRLASFIEWYVLEHREGGGATWAERFLEGLEPEELQRAAQLAASHRSLFAVKRLNRWGLSLSDLLGGGRFEVSCRVPPGLRRGDLFEGRIIPWGGSLLLGHTQIFHPYEARGAISRQAEAARARREPPDIVLARLARMRLRFDRYRKIPLEKIYDPAAIFGR